MSKPNLLARLTGNVPLAQLNPEELMNRRSAAEAAVAQAERLYQKAALAVEVEGPSANAALVEATETLRYAQEKVRNIAAAQIEADALRAHEAQQARAAAVEREDKAALADFKALANAGKEMEVAAANYAAAWGKLSKASAAAQAHQVSNPRLRQVGVSILELTTREVARAASAASVSFPPGAAVGAASLSNPAKWQSISGVLSDVLASVLPAKPVRA